MSLTETLRTTLPPVTTDPPEGDWVNRCPDCGAPFVVLEDVVREAIGTRLGQALAVIGPRDMRVFCVREHEWRVSDAIRTTDRGYGFKLTGARG